jgi:hypothetical protein
MNTKERIIGLIESGEILISHHARVRMFERDVSTDDLITICRVPQLMSVLLTEFMSAFNIFSVFVEIDFVHVN